MAYDNNTPGDIKLYYPNSGDDWASEIEEDLEKLDNFKIRLIYNTRASTLGNPINIHATQSDTNYVVTNKQVHATNTRFTIAESARLSFNQVNQTYTDIIGTDITTLTPAAREGGYIHTIDWSDYTYTSGYNIGLLLNSGQQHSYCDFVIWQKDSQDDWYEAAKISIPVMCYYAPL